MRIRVEGLTKAFPVDGQRRQVLDGVSFEVGSGTFTSVVGPSGCGKSTLFGVLAGLVEPDDGRVLVDGAPAAGSRFAYMPQQDLLFDWRTVLDNTALGLEVQGMRRREARERAGALFATFGLDGFEDARPRQLSGGMRQRAALLRTVVQGRDVLLLDEPLGALDALTRTGMQVWLEGMWRRFGWTVLLITHDVREAVLLSDQVVVLGPRPAVVRGVVPVPLPRPRDAAVQRSAACAAAEADLSDALALSRPSDGA